jgi:hypothetical protein
MEYVVNQTRITAEQIELRAKDPIEVVARIAAGGGRFWLFKTQPKSSFEIAWDLAHC